jgi:glutamate synthase domain-containing protein 3
LSFCVLQGSVSKSYDIINVDRSALGRVAGAIAKPYGDNGFKGAVNLKLTGALSLLLLDVFNQGKTNNRTVVQ